MLRLPKQTIHDVDGQTLLIRCDAEVAVFTGLADGARRVAGAIEPHRAPTLVALGLDTPARLRRLQKKDAPKPMVSECTGEARAVGSPVSPPESTSKGCAKSVPPHEQQVSECVADG